MSKGRKAMYCLAMDFRAGDTLYGFTVKHVGRIDDYRAESVLLEHRTGFQVYAVLIARDSSHMPYIPRLHRGRA